ncbi:extracellular solute-binding protein [Saccharothrix saharensis]|uniref:extracellular solute-binding protein n=1 Tax=Saccharothrix saharensis TaxID=571190 RepID=UPI001B87C7A7|nr:extracellular solute-binding protein [Saccharothrix saharensis]
MLIAIMLLVGVAVTMVSTILVTEVDESWTAGSVTRGVLSAVLVLFSGVYVNLMLAGIVKVWRDPGSANRSLDKTIRDVRGWLGEKTKWLGIALTMALIVAAGVALRPSPPPDTGLEEGKLVVMTAFDESANDPRLMLIKLWNQLHPANQVEVVFVSGEPDQQNVRMVNDAKPDGAHEADVYVLDLVWMAQFREERYIRELDRSTLAGLDDFVPKVFGTCVHEGKLWCLPLNTDVGLLYYRTDLPLAVKPPTKWEQYFGADAAAAAAGTPQVDAANAAPLANEEILTVMALEAMWAAGGKAFGENGDVAQNEDKTSVQLGAGDEIGLRELAAAAHDDRVVVTAEARSTTDDVAVRTFADGRTLYMRNWPVARDGLRDRVGFGVAALPTAGVLGGQNLAIRAGTGKPRAAQALVDFLTSAASQLILSEVGGFAPTRQSAYDNAKRRDMQELRSALSSARLRPVTRHYVEFSQVFRDGVAEAINDRSGRLKPETLQRLAKILNQ